MKKRILSISLFLLFAAGSAQGANDIELRASDLAEGYKFSDSLWKLIEFLPSDPLDHDTKVFFYPAWDGRTATAFFARKGGGHVIVKGYRLDRLLMQASREAHDPARKFDYVRDFPAYFDPEDLPRAEDGLRYGDLFLHGDPMIFSERGTSVDDLLDTQMEWAIMVNDRTAAEIQEQYDRSAGDEDHPATSEDLLRFTTSISYMFLGSCAL